MMTRPFNEEFREQYKKAYSLYNRGRWKDAKYEFEYAKELCVEPDPLSDNHLSYMKEFDYEAPDDWEGWKEVDA